MKNLSVIETMDVKELSKLEVYDLADLNEQIAKLVSHTKELKEKLEGADFTFFKNSSKQAA